MWEHEARSLGALRDVSCDENRISDDRCFGVEVDMSCEIVDHSSRVIRVVSNKRSDEVVILHYEIRDIIDS